MCGVLDTLITSRQLLVTRTVHMFCVVELYSTSQQIKGRCLLCAGKFEEGEISECKKYKSGKKSFLVTSVCTFREK